MRSLASPPVYSVAEYDKMRCYFRKMTSFYSTYCRVLDHKYRL